MLKEGDKVTLSIAPTIEVAKFNFIKSSASVTRVLSGNVEADLQEMEVAVRHQYLRSVKIELRMIDELVKVVEEGGLDNLAEYVVEELHSGAKATAIEVESGDAKPSIAAPVKKGPSKKVLVKKGAIKKGKLKSISG